MDFIWATKDTFLILKFTPLQTYAKIPTSKAKRNEFSK